MAKHSVTEHVKVSMINELKYSQSTSRPQTEGKDEMDRICRTYGADEKLIMRKYLASLGVNWMIILKWFLKK
jgi:hypothetical protein